MRTRKEIDAARKAERLERIAEQVASGRLVIRKATDADRTAFAQAKARRDRGARR